MPSRQNLINRIISGDLMSREDQISEFNQYQNDERDDDYNLIITPMPENIHIFHSYYSYEDYNGYGYLWGYDSDRDVFFYNSGSHCSCYGLEGQWDIEDHTYEEMVNYIERQIENDKDEEVRESYGYDSVKAEGRVELLKIILGEV
jgi:hypothetical protein